MASTLSNKQKKKEKYTLNELKSLGHDLLSSRSHINNLPLLLSFVSPESPPQFVVESLLSLQSFFTPLLSQLPSTSSSPSSTKRPRSEDDDPEVVFKAWLRSKFDEFVKLLLDVLVSQQSEDALRGIVLGTLMEFVKLLNVGRFHSSIYHRLLHAIIHSAVDIEIFLDILTSKYIKYIDVRYFTYISMEKFVKTLEASVVSADRTAIKNKEAENDSKESLELSVRKIYQVLSQIPPPEKQAEKSHHEMWSGSDESRSEKLTDKQKKTEERDSILLSPTTISKRMKLKFTKAWISFLRLPLPLDVYKEVLASIHQTVIPHLSNPTMLCDFLTKSYDIGGVVSVMALSSLFILMTQHGLEYPNFYEKLYALLVPSVFVAKHRAKFLQLLDACLKSSMLPAYLAASFTKKLSRLSLSIPPAGSLVITALIYNLLRRHPTINHLVQETVENADEADAEADQDNESQPKTNKKQKLGIDYFNNQESDPKKSGALKSSLWEIDTLRHHYCPPVSRFISSLETDLTIRAKTTEMKIEDYSSGSYATIFGDEIRRRVKQVPTAFYKVIPASLFEDSDFPGWTFTIPLDLDSIGCFPGFEDGEFESAKMLRPTGTLYDEEEDCLYIVDSENHAIRRANINSRVLETVYPKVIRKTGGLWSWIMEKMGLGKDDDTTLDADAQSEEFDARSLLFPWHILKQDDKSLLVSNKSFSKLWIINLASGEIEEVVEGFPKIMEICGQSITEKLSVLKHMPSTWLQQQTEAITSSKEQPSASLLSSFTKLGDNIVMTDIACQRVLKLNRESGACSSIQFSNVGILGLPYWLFIPLERVFNLANGVQEAHLSHTQELRLLPGKISVRLNIEIPPCTELVEPIQEPCIWRQTRGAISEVSTPGSAAEPSEKVGVSQQWYDELDSLAKEIANPEAAEEEEEADVNPSEIEREEDGRIRIDCTVKTSPGTSELIVYAALYLRLARNEETESASQEELARRIAEILKPVRNITTMKEDLFVKLLSKSKRELRDIVFLKPMHVRIRLDSMDHPKADNSRDVILTDSSVEVDVSL